MNATGESTIVFVQKENLFGLELGILLSVVRNAGFSAEVLSEEVEGEGLLPKVEAMNPLMIGGYTDTFDLYRENVFGDYAELLGSIKEAQPQVTTFLGGIHSTMNPDMLRDSSAFDLLFLGDMESSLVEVAERLHSGESCHEVRGIAYRSEDEIVRTPFARLTNLSEIPRPDVDSFLRHSGAFRYGHRLAFARGCPNKCSFCFNPKYAEGAGTATSSLPRYYPPQYLIDIVNEYAAKDPDCRNIYFSYGTFSHDKDYTLDLCRSYADQVTLPYICSTRLDRVDDEIAAWLKRSGCSKVTVALETGVERLRNEVLKKGLRDTEIRRGMAILKRHGLRVGCNVIMGFPGETLDDAFASLDLIRELDADFFTVFMYSPLAGSELAQRAVDEGYLPENYGMGNHTMYEMNLDIEHGKQLVNLSCLASFYMRFPSKPLAKLLTRLPRNRFFDLVKHLPRIKAVLKYDMDGSKRSEKTRYMSYALASILLRGRTPETIAARKTKRETAAASAGS